MKCCMCNEKIPYSDHFMIASNGRTFCKVCGRKYLRGRYEVRNSNSDNHNLRTDSPK